MELWPTQWGAPRCQEGVSGNAGKKKRHSSSSPCLTFRNGIFCILVESSWLLLRFFHQSVWVQHLAWLYVDDYLGLQGRDLRSGKTKGTSFCGYLHQLQKHSRTPRLYLDKTIGLLMWITQLGLLMWITQLFPFMPQLLQFFEWSVGICSRTSDYCNSDGATPVSVRHQTIKSKENLRIHEFHTSGSGWESETLLQTNVICQIILHASWRCS